MSQLQTIEVPVAGMDCTECTAHVRNAIAGLDGVASVEVYLASERAKVVVDPEQVNLDAIRQAVERAGYSVPDQAAPAGRGAEAGQDRRAGWLLAGLAALVLFVVVAGEWLGLFDWLAETVPMPVGLALVLIAGFPVFREVVRATLQGRIISHTLMTLGVIAALAVGQWPTALVVVFFMRVGDYVEGFTTERARTALKDLAALAPAQATVVRDGAEATVAADAVQPGEIVIVRPGEQIPVDGEVTEGQAAVGQANITGESMPVEAGPGSHVYASSFVQAGYLRVRATEAGADTTFGKIVRMVEEAEGNRADVQRTADRFAAYYLPVVAVIGLLTLIISRDPLSAAAVLLVACSCSFALATPIAMLASIGAAARHGLLIKGGRYLEALARADVLLIDKTGTLTLGKPIVTDILLADGEWLMADGRWRMADGRWRMADGQEVATIGHQPPATSYQPSAISYQPPAISYQPPAISYQPPAISYQPPAISYQPPATGHLLYLAASAERYSEHPVAGAVRAAALERGLKLSEPNDFVSEPGKGVRATVDGKRVAVGNRRLLGDATVAPDAAAALEAAGKTAFYVTVDEEPAGIIAVADTLRPQVPAAIQELRGMGVSEIELLTGDNERTAAALAAQVGVAYRANLLPEDKLRIVREYQAQGRVVVMVGDGVNDAPALAQADVGIAMGAAGADLAIEAADVALLRDDWSRVPELFRIAHRTMRVVRTNLGFTVLYNTVGLTLAAFGFLPPIWAAAAQSLPDLGVLANSSRLLKSET
jgi:Cd2+/Zn2+-exporting ATPase/Cu+-exporting ATPase